MTDDLTDTTLPGEPDDIDTSAEPETDTVPDPPPNPDADGGDAEEKP